MHESSESFERLLEKCAEEPIRVPGSIQSCGCLLAARAGDDAIVYASENTAKYLNRSAAGLLDHSARELFGAAVWNDVLRNVDETPTGRSLDECAGRQAALHLTVHQSGPYIVCEIEPRNEADGSLLGSFYEMQEQLLDRTSLEEVLQEGVESVARLTGYEHVMIYRFHSNWDGEVVAERVSDRRPVYRGHRFPASDIPKQARELYRENMFRIIADVTYEPVSIVARTDEPIDLSRAWLRSVSPIHLRYLLNMGVRASLSISIIVDDRLWGLIACHHAEPRFLSHNCRRIVEFFGRQFSTQVTLALEQQRQRYLDRYQKVLQVPHRFLGEEQSLTHHLESHGNALLELLEADGLILRLFGESRTVGEVPPGRECRRLMEWLGGQDIEEVWYTDYLSASYPGADDIVDRASGVLVLELPQEGSRLVWLRAEVVRTIEWGGNPYEPVTQDEDTGRLSPRNSFETWKEQLDRHSKPWSPDQVAAARVFRQHMLEAVMGESRRRRSEQLDVIHQILRHDIQNKAGVIGAYADMLTDVEEPRMKRYARRIAQASQDTIALTKSAWALTRVIRSGGEVERSSTDVNAVVERIVESMEATYGDAAVTMDASKTDGETLLVEAGPLLDSVIRNLVSNAIKHNNKDWKKVHVEVEEHPSTVQIRVADNGPGIPASEREKIFAEGETRLEEASTGVGLYLVRLITRQHEGKVWVVDSKPEGSTFTVALQKTEAVSE
jgi:light-regulated signal transduction histidine kinase (bacteriophytochrome)